MRYLKYFVIFALMLGIFAGISVSASETETDWSTVDWATFDWSQVDWYAIDYNQVDWEKADISAMIRAMYTGLYEDTEGKRLSRFWDWVENEASLSLAFEISMHTDGASSETLSVVLYDRFAQDPYAWIKALAKEDAAMQEHVHDRLRYAVVDSEAYNQLLMQVNMTMDYSEDEQDLWKAMLKAAPEMDWTGVDWSQLDWNTTNTYKVDWDLVDWSNTNIKAMFKRMLTYVFYDSYNPFTNWLNEQAELEEVLIIKKSSDGAVSESCSFVLYDHFAKDPYGVVQAIAREPDAYWHTIFASSIVYGADYPFDPLSQILGSDVLPETATDVERAVWAEIIREAERQWNVVPTGDGIGMPMILLLVSAAGLALLVSKKRMLVK